MEEKKLTDEEIVKALESCAKPGGCHECPLGEVDCSIEECRGLTLTSALDLIKRQKAEIKRLTEEKDKYQEKWQTSYMNELNLQKQVDELKTENKELYKEHTTLIAGSILKQQDIVKDTAKEIYAQMLEWIPIGEGYSTFIDNFEMWIKERYGVEVE